MNCTAPIAARRIRVAEIKALTPDVRLYRLIPADGRPLPAFTAGAHIDVYIPGGSIRQFSLCGDLEDTSTYAIAVKREPQGRGGSAALHDLVEAGTLMGIGLPRNNFPLAEDAAKHIFIAGGIGITPFIPMIALAQRTSVPWELHYCARSRGHAAFYDDLKALAPKRVHEYFSEAPLFDAQQFARAPEHAVHVYCCGPVGLMSAVQDATEGWPGAQVHFEWFANELTDDGPQEPFEIELKSDGQVLTVPAGRSILEVLREAGLPAVSSCQEGVCGACETAVLAGEPQHRDKVLTSAERAANKTMMICVSRAKGGRLVLDI